MEVMPWTYKTNSRSLMVGHDRSFLKPALFQHAPEEISKYLRTSMILRGDEAALIYKISTETWEAPKIGSFCCIIPSETKTNMRPLRKRNTLVTGLYANFFRIFMQFVSSSLWSKCNSKQCV